MKIPFLQGGKNEDQVVMLHTAKIRANPYQPRTGFEQAEINELAESIKNYGVIQPITVRPAGDGYELIAGERRLRASQQLGRDKIPAVVKDLDDQQVAEIALVENLQRKDLSFLEEADAYQHLLQRFDLTQSELARKIGKSQSTIANKLRLLTLPTDVRQHIDSHISERHARALLKLEDPVKQVSVISQIKEGELTVKETEKLIDRLINGHEQGEKEGTNIKTVYKDLRLFTNTLNNTIKQMKKAGLEVKVDQQEEDQYIEFNIRLLK